MPGSRPRYTQYAEAAYVLDPTKSGKRVVQEPEQDEDDGIQPSSYKVAYKVTKLYHDEDLQLQDVYFDEAGLAVVQAPGVRATIHAQSCRISNQQEEIEKCKADMKYRDSIESQNQATIADLEQGKSDLRANLAQNQETIYRLEQENSKLAADLSQSRRDLEKESGRVREANEQLDVGDATLKQVTAERDEAKQSLLEEQTKRMEENVSHEDDVAKLRLRCEELEKAAREDSKAVSNASKDSGMDEDDLAYNLEVSQERVKQAERERDEKQEIIDDLRNRDAVAVDKNVAALEKELSRYKEYLKAANGEIARLTPTQEDEEMAEGDSDDDSIAPSTPDSVPSSILAGSKASTPATSSSSSLSSVGDSSDLTELTDAQLEGLKAATMLGIDDRFDEINTERSKSLAERLASQSKLPAKPSQRSKQPQRASNAELSARTPIVKSSKTTSVVKSKLRLAALEAEAKRLKKIAPSSKVAVNALSPSDPQRKPKSTAEIQRQTEDQLPKAKTAEEASDFDDSQYVRAKTLHDDNDYAGLAKAGLRGRQVWNGDYTSMLYLSNHIDSKDTIMAQLGSRGELASSRNPYLRFEENTIRAENDEDDISDSTDVDGFILQCALAHVPEVHMQAAYDVIFDDDEDCDRFKAKFERERGLDRRCKEMTDHKEEWDRAVGKLAKLEQFREACIAWIAGEPSTGKWWWPPTFTDPALAAALSLNPEADLAQTKEELERSKLGKAFEEHTDINSLHEDKLIAAFAPTMERNLDTSEFDRQGRTTEMGMYGPGADKKRSVEKARKVIAEE